ncbi:hypothetical protein B0H63DRAFT_462440 [Podospora didyma]|uniref:Heterokaryon incompatibility domain-containing protein n=1 Tax=Podospora didyma TaxID=330526 RepID=A0AAE0P7T7_9PEZI|nr:hypothetical protein B0H63DRAFT_462440 [Podospora didyma]
MDEVATVGQCYLGLGSDDEHGQLGDGRLDSRTRLWLFELQRLAQSSLSEGTGNQSVRIARVAMTGHTIPQTTSLSGISLETAWGDFESLMPGIMDGSLKHGTEHYYLPLSSVIRSYCRNRRAFVTSKGWLGIGPLDIKEGDAAAVVVGAQVPFLLRMAQERRWRLVGEAYVEGLMNGESFGDRPAVEVIELC